MVCVAWFFSMQSVGTGLVALVQPPGQHFQHRLRRRHPLQPCRPACGGSPDACASGLPKVWRSLA